MNNNQECPFPSGSKVAAYLRDSGGDDQDLSLDQQSEEIKKWVIKHGLILTRIFQDEAQPGSSVVKREAFLDMISYFRNEAREEGVVIWSYSRFSRDIDDATFYKSDLRRRGYLIYSLTDSIPSGLDGYLLESVLAWKDARFLEDLSKDVKRGLAHLVREYRAVPGVPPKGFKRKPINIGKKRDGRDHIVHQWVPDPELIPLVQKAFEMRAASKTYTEIHKETRLFGSKNSYVSFFRNRIFIGELVYGGMVIEDYCKPIIEKDIWNRVQMFHRVRKVTNNAFHPRRVGRSSFILSGIIFCAKCGSPLNGHVISNGNGGGRWTYYTCSRRRRRKDCDVAAIPQAILETRVLEELRTRVLTPENLNHLQEELRIVYKDKKKGKGNEKNYLSKQLNKTIMQINNVAEAIARAGGSRTLLDKLKSLEVEEGETRTMLAEIERKSEPDFDIDLIEVSKLATNVLEKSYLKDANKREQIKQLLRGFIYRIEVVRNKKIITGTIYYYKPEISMQDLKKKNEDPSVPMILKPVGALHRHGFREKIVRRNAKKASR